MKPGLRMQLWIYHLLSPHPPLVDFSKFNLDEENICPLVAPLGIPRIFSKGRMGILVRIRHLDSRLKWVSTSSTYTIILWSWEALFPLTKFCTFLSRGVISLLRGDSQMWNSSFTFNSYSNATEWMLSSISISILNTLLQHTYMIPQKV